MALTNKLTAIADAIRGKTGKTEEMTLDQMAIEIAGISGGGGGGLAYDMGEFVLDADITSLQTANGIPHALGEAPDFVLIWTDDFCDLSADNVNPYGANVSMGYIWLNGLTGLSQRITSTMRSELGLFVAFTLQGNAYSLAAGTPTSTSYFMHDVYFPNEEKIALVLLSNTAQKYKAGLTYKYFVSKAWWNVGGVANAE